MNKKILVVVSHPDDEILGCGGSLIKHIKKGDRVKVIFTSESEKARNINNLNKAKKKSKSRKEVAKNVSKLLKFDEPIFLNFNNLSLTREDVTIMNGQLREIIQTFRPSTIYTHSPNDIHHDHRKTFEATIIASQLLKNLTINKILTFEIPGSSTIDSHNSFYPNYFINIEDEIKSKLKILKKYQNEMKKYPHQRSLIGVYNLSIYRGNMINLNYAEAFNLIRYIK